MYESHRRLERAGISEDAWVRDDADEAAQDEVRDRIRLIRVQEVFEPVAEPNVIRRVASGA